MNRGVILRDFEIEDLKVMDIRDNEYAAIANFAEVLEIAIEKGDAKTIIYGKDILGSIGYYELRPGVCEVWCFYNEDSNRGGVFLLVVKDALRKLFNDNDYHRIQATGLHDLKGDVFFEKLGFQSEGILRKYSTSGRDYKMWSRVK